MGAIASQITSLTNVYSTVCSNADQRKHESSASLAFVRGIHRWPMNSPHKWPVTRIMFPFDDVIMFSPIRYIHRFSSRSKECSSKSYQPDGTTHAQFPFHSATINGKGAVYPIINTTYPLTHWSRDKIAAIFQTTFSNAFSWKKMYQFRLGFHRSLFPGVQLTIF